MKNNDGDGLGDEDDSSLELSDKRNLVTEEVNKTEDHIIDGQDQGNIHYSNVLDKGKELQAGVYTVCCIVIICVHTPLREIVSDMSIIDFVSYLCSYM